MTDPFARLRRFLRELKRRNVYKVAATYAVVGFLLIQAADLIFPALNIPSWGYSLVVVLILFGFPIALIVAWAFEMSPEGMRRTPATSEAEEASESEAMAPGERRAESRLAMKALVGLGLVGAAVVGGWYLMGGGGEPPTETAASADTASTDPRAGDRSIAVLPFENMGGEESEQFTQGVHDGLLTRLSNISDLKVISRTSVMQYQETDETVPQIARELGAQWVVEGAVQQAGGQVQVNAQLIEAREDAHQWAETYRRELNPQNLFAIQSELTKKIAHSLEAQLSSGERERVEERPTGDLQAYRAYVRGRRELAQRTFGGGEHVRQAVRHFRQATERDSSFALAWAGLADAATAFHRIGAPDSAAALGLEPEAAARRALELDPGLAEAHASLGRVHYRNQNAPAALRELKRATELKPSYWEAHQSLGWVYVILDRPRRALKHFQLAVELNPQHALARHGLYDAYNWTGQDKKSLREARRQQEMGLEEESAIGGQVRALYNLGRLDEARELARKQAERLDAGTQWGGWFRVYLVEILTAEGDTARARDYLDQLQDGEAAPRMLAVAHMSLGEPNQALEAYGRLEAEDWNFVSLFGIRLLEEKYPSLQEDPRYRQIHGEANRAWGLNPDGSLPDSVDVSFDSVAGE